MARYCIEAYYSINEAQQNGLLKLDGFNKLSYKDQEKVLHQFANKLKTIYNFLNQAKPVINKFFTDYAAYRGQLPAGYLDRAPFSKVLDMIYSRGAILAHLAPYEPYFDINNLKTVCYSLKTAFRDAVDPSGQRDASANEYQNAAQIAYNALNEEFQNDPVNKLLLSIKSSYDALVNQIKSDFTFIKGDLQGLGLKVGKGVENVAYQAGRFAGAVGDVAGRLHGEISGSTADEIIRKNVERAGESFTNEPTKSVKSPPIKPMDPSLHADRVARYEAAKAARQSGNGFSEGLIKGISDSMTDDPDIFIS